jgi:CDP-glucose 4,6-dehydratase
VAIARCGNIYGGGDLNWSRLVPGTIKWLLHGEQPVLRSDGTFLRDYLHVDDAVSAYLALGAGLEKATISGGAFNFSDESPLSVREVYDAVCRATTGEIVEPEVLGQARDEIHDQYLSSEKARELLGWRAQVSLDEGLARTVDWYRGFFDLPSS